MVDVAMQQNDESSSSVTGRLHVTGEQRDAAATTP
jgi:hypothetical protein